MAACPNGHDSATADYCDQCGAKIAENVTPISATASSPSSPAAPAGSECPNCQSSRTAQEKFCEVCGYDFASGTLPSAPVPGPAPAQPAAPSAVPSGPPWQAVVSADRAYYDRNDVEGIAFPDHCPERMFSLVDDEILIGRHSPSRGVHPQIDLSGAPEDTGISHSHAILRKQPDGSYCVIDPGSTNGTFANEADEPVAPNTAVPIADGDRLYVGAWTKIVFHAPR